jgi:hypothetical protein
MDVVFIECVYCRSEDNSRGINGKTYTVVLKVLKMSEGVEGEGSLHIIW